MSNNKEKDKNLISSHEAIRKDTEGNYSFDLYNSEDNLGFAVSDKKESAHGSAFSYFQNLKSSLAKHKNAGNKSHEKFDYQFSALDKSVDELVSSNEDSSDLYNFEKNGELNVFGMVNEKGKKIDSKAKAQNLYMDNQAPKQAQKFSDDEINFDEKVLNRETGEDIFKKKFRYEAEDAYALSNRSYKKHLKFILSLIAFLFVAFLIFLYIFSKPFNFYEKIVDPYSIYRQQQDLIFKEKNLEDAQNEMNEIKEALLAIDKNKGQDNESGDEKGLFVDDTKVNLDFDRSKISSESIYLYNLTDDVPVFMWKAQLSLDLAAITQIFTTDIYMSYLKNPYKEVQVPSEIVFYLYDQNARQSGFAPGEKCAMIDLAYASILSGATDCAMAEAYYVSGNQSDFVDLMNNYATELNLENTNFVNSSGLPAEKHYSSAEDIGVFFRHIYKDARMMKILQTKKYITKKTDFRPDGLMIENAVLKYFDKNPINGVKVLAGRTGANPNSGRSLVTISEKNGKKYLLVTLSAKKYGSNSEAHDHYEDHNMILGEFLK